MACSAKRISAVIACSLLLLVPLPLHADWSDLPDFFSSGSKKAAATVPSPTVKAPPTAAGKSAVAAPAAVKPVIAVAAVPRDKAPFSPSLTLGTQQLTVDSEWRGAVYVNGGVTIAPTATLAIHPGTVVRFARGAGIHVLGRIVVKGAPGNPVRLASLYRESQDSDWSGIILSGTEKKNIFENVVIEGAETAILARFSSLSAAFVTIGNSAGGIKLQSSTATITNTVIAVPVTAITATQSELFMEKCSISGGQSGVIINSSAVEAREVTIKSCRLTAFSAAASQLKLESMTVEGCQSGMRFTKCGGSIRNASIRNNLETGVVLNSSNVRFTGNTLTGNKVGIQIDDGQPSLWANTSSGNSKYDLIYLGEESLFAGGNNFGDQPAGETDNKLFSKRPGAVQIAPFTAVERLPDAN